MEDKICVVGLGYVGLPLAMSFARHYEVIGFDVDAKKIEELNSGYDRTGVFNKDDFSIVSKNIKFTNDEKSIGECKIIIVAVPTPITADKKPDLSYLKSASEIVGKNMKRGSIVVFESTTYPGCTEEFCLPILEKESGMKLGDFHIGYSPERINPGDEEHRLENIIKIVAGDIPKTTKILANIYSAITKVYIAPSIKVAEAAKVIENTQRDLNIALFNELAMLFDKLNIDSKAVFDAASTKWNFIRFSPGLVGGHCIPVDPYYLANKAMEVGYIPELILAGRRINENIPKFIATKIIKMLIKEGKSVNNARVVIWGATYKENVPDLRESKVRLLIDELKDFGMDNITLFEPLLNKKEIFGVNNVDTPLKRYYDVVVYAVNHKIFSKYEIKEYLRTRGIVIDIKRVLDKKDLEKSGFVYWGL